ncbi:MAG: hypothetical protein ACLQUY_18545 [Ktedonobacterales bacterium]
MSWSVFPFDTRFPSVGTFSTISFITGYLPVDRQTDRTYNLAQRHGPSSAFANADYPRLGGEHEGKPHLVSQSIDTPPLAGTTQSVVHVPASIRQVMAEVALASGRSESDLWSEAADAWLSAHIYDDKPLPPAPAAALPLPNRCWDMIDDLLASLRRSSPNDFGERSKRAA